VVQVQALGYSQAHHGWTNIWNYKLEYGMFALTSTNAMHYLIGET
jgi:hypothetical protein